MNKHRSTMLPFAGAVALAAWVGLSAASAQSPAQQPPPPPAPTQQQTSPMPPAPPLPAEPQAPPTTQRPAQPAMPMPPPAQQGRMPASAQQANATKFIPGTQSSATYQIPNGTLTVNAGMPAHVKNYGPPPPFKSLDGNHNGRINQTEAKGYPPLDNDFLYVSGGRKTISHTQYSRWAKTQH